MRSLLLAVGALVIVLYVAKPAGPWEFDEILFYQSLHEFNPIAHHPPPPGYPLFSGFGHLVRLLIPSDFATLVTISFLGSIIAFLFFARAFGSIAGDMTIGIAAALLFYFSPAMLVNATLPMSEPGALALLAVALSCISRPWLFGCFLALTVGWRPQFAIFVVPVLIVSVIQMRTWRDRAIAVATFTIICLAWLVPLASAVGGVDRLIRFEAGQAGYVSQHDADVSRSGWTSSQLAFRFIAHPWGTKLESLPILLLAAIGVILMRRNRRVLPVAIASLVYVVFALAIMDPADGVRYAIPFVLGTAFFAAVGAVWATRMLGTPSYAVVALFAIGSMVYVSSLIAQRSSTSSPPAYAASVAKLTFPSNAVPLYELPLWPHAQYFFRDRQSFRVNDGLAAYFDRPDIPLFIYADGVSRARDARVFRWQPSDAYSKLTRNHYRVVSLIPLTPDQRFRVIRGVYVPEREIDGEEWRWLDSPAELQLPHGPARLLTMRIGLPVIYPMEKNTLTISVDGGDERVTVLDRGKPTTITIRVPAGAPVIHFETAKTFVPAEVPGSLNRDPRRLAVKLYDLSAK